MFLVDTNIFLEILLEQERKDDCERFLKENIGDLAISDFSFHSIGVILFRNDCQGIFTMFIQDVLPNVRIVSLPLREYQQLQASGEEVGLDFDDLYQYSVCKALSLELVTMDHDFDKVGGKLKVMYL